MDRNISFLVIQVNVSFSYKKTVFTTDFCMTTSRCAVRQKQGQAGSVITGTRWEQDRSYDELAEAVLWPGHFSSATEPEDHAGQAAQCSTAQAVQLTAICIAKSAACNHLLVKINTFNPSIYIELYFPNKIRDYINNTRASQALNKISNGADKACSGSLTSQIHLLHASQYKQWKR